MKKNELHLSLQALAGDENTKIEPGTEVSFTATGRVTRLEDGRACVALATINGQPIADPAGADESGSGPTKEQLIAELQAGGFA